MKELILITVVLTSLFSGCADPKQETPKEREPSTQDLLEMTTAYYPKGKYYGIGPFVSYSLEQSQYIIVNR